MGMPLGGMPASGQLPGLGRVKVVDLAKDAQQNKGDLSDNRDKLNSAYFSLQPAAGAASPGFGSMLREAGEKRANFEEAKKALAAHRLGQVQEGRLGVELSLDSSGLRNQSRLTQTALKNVAGRNCLEYAGVWIDEGFDAKTPTLTVKAQSDAYFQLTRTPAPASRSVQAGQLPGLADSQRHGTGHRSQRREGKTGRCRDRRAVQSEAVAGGRRQESGDRRQGSGIRGQESGIRSQESGVRSQESGIRRQESGIRRQETGVRSQGSLVFL